MKYFLLQTRCLPSKNHWYLLHIFARRFFSMEEFRIIRPTSILAPYVKHYWHLKTTGDAASGVRTVPTGMMSLIFHRGSRLLSVRENELHPRVFLCGHEKTFDDLKYRGQVDMIVVVFRPAGIRAFFPLPVDKVSGLRLTAGDLEDKELSTLENSMISTGDDRQCMRLIEQFLLKRCTKLAEYKLKRIEAAIRLIDSGQTNIASLADAACLSTKQFTRQFSEYVGANPKEFSQTIRFQRALHILETNPATNLTSLACEGGYYDQSHLIKEFKTLSGYTPGEYIAMCPPHSDYFN